MGHQISNCKGLFNYADMEAVGWEVSKEEVWLAVSLLKRSCDLNDVL